SPIIILTQIITKTYNILGDYMHLTINDVNLYYEKYGDKPLNILILPGWGNTRKTFNYMINF
ncbi:MAG TPA: hypothetical protein PLT65_05575, partial [Bacilli bacterium]|nr:hypothetical protein [Bacilli bacterium]